MGASSSTNAEERIRDLEVSLQHERATVSMLKASLVSEREALHRVRSNIYKGLAAGAGATLLACAAGVALLRRQVVAARLATERLCSTRHELALTDLRRHAAADLEKAEKFAVDTFARDLLPIADSLEYAQQHTQQLRDPAPAASEAPVASLSALAQGIELTERSLLDAFGKHGIAKQAPLGEQFDPNAHEAVLQVPDAKVAVAVKPIDMQSDATVGSE
eukprot:gnl/TRDRNA2_/TRDRNA2_80578_c0_seq1.p1 gnl/TRDRNA2_/TRDRNA2_80578_c0~~gnl/TRDRNA2_/TRDRNA2_80578_c0_seq1.p1  ORF type:complete len:219 (-),score=44.38 gnl/TRDRNA2_/TRDRNA2_80578_c0_seq1:23-679(-)